MPRLLLSNTFRATTAPSYPRCTYYTSIANITLDARQLVALPRRPKLFYQHPFFRSFTLNILSLSPNISASGGLLWGPYARGGAFSGGGWRGAKLPHAHGSGTTCDLSESLQQYTSAANDALAPSSQQLFVPLL